MTKSTHIFFTIFVITALFFYVPQIYAYTDAELTAKYHDLPAIQDALNSGELKCTDLPDNIKSASCTDDAHKVVLPDGSDAPSPISANTVWLIGGVMTGIIIIPLLGKIFLTSFEFRKPKSYKYDNESKGWNEEVSLLHSFLIKVGLAHHVQGTSKEPEVNTTNYDLSGIEDSVDKDRVSHELDEGFTSNDDYFKNKKPRTRKENQKTDSELSGFQQILLSLGILKVSK